VINTSRLRPEDRAFLAAFLVPLSRGPLRHLRLLVSPDTVLRWHRDLMKHRHTRASQGRGAGRPRTIASILYRSESRRCWSEAARAQSRTTEMLSG
jgi:hypothetical protein